MTADVASWLAATLDEVEREAHARAALIPSLSALAGSHTPVVLAGVEADRAILALHPRTPHYSHTLGLTYRQESSGEHEPSLWYCGGCQSEDGLITGEFPCDTVLLVASRYRHRPGYRAEEWRV